MAAGLGLAIPASAEAKLRFRTCGEASCAVLSVPLDHSGAVPGRLSLRVERYPGFGRRQREVTLALADRPGEAVLPTDEFPWDDVRRALVRFDQRGTGAGALRCRDLEAAAATDAGREAAACATLLGERRAFYRTSDTVEDIEALRVELGVERMSIVGPGYGGYVAQRYAMRYPDRVERLLLVSPADAAGLDPLYRDSMAAVRRVLPELCSSRCGNFTSDALGDTARLVERLAREPLRGTIVGPTGHRRTAVLSRQELLFTLMAGDDDLVSQPEYPAAVVSALRGDAAPILREKRRAVTESRNPRPAIVSTATHAATLCEEVRFPWSWHASPAERDAAAFSTETAMDPLLAAPFDPGTLVRSDLTRPAAAGRRPPDPAAGTRPDARHAGARARRSGRDRALARDRPPHGGALRPGAKVLQTPGQFPLFGRRYSRCRQRGPALSRRRRAQGRCRRATAGGVARDSGARSLSDLTPAGAVSWSPGPDAAGVWRDLRRPCEQLYVDAFLNIGRSNSSTDGR